MSDDVKDYTEGNGDNSHYRGVTSEFSKRVESQFKMQPKYCEPGHADGDMKGSKRNEQEAP